MFYEGEYNFAKNKEIMRVAAQYCRLDTPFVITGDYSGSVRRKVTVDNFRRDNIEKARDASNDLTQIDTVRTLGLDSLCDAHGVCRRHDYVEVTDFFADLAEAEENYSPFKAEGDDDCELEMKKRRRLFDVLFDDNDVFGVRRLKKNDLTDLVLTLLNRGKLLIFGKNTKMSDKEFATRIFREFIATAGGPGTHDCLLALIDAGANVNGFVKNSGLEQLPTLAHAVWCRSVKIIELLLRHGADSKFNGGGRVLRCPLLEALKLGQIEIAQLLLLNGAELETEETPKLAFERTENDPGLKLCATLLKPRMCHKLKDVFVSDHFVNGSPEVKEGVVSLVFRALKAQDLSLFFMDANDFLQTPLTALLNKDASPKLIRHIVNLMGATFINASRSILMSEWSNFGHDALTLAAMGLARSDSKAIDNFMEIAEILLEGGFDYDQAKAESSKGQNSSTTRSSYPFLPPSGSQRGTIEYSAYSTFEQHIIDHCESVNAEVKAKRNAAK